MTGADKDSLQWQGKGPSGREGEASPYQAGTPDAAQPTKGESRTAPPSQHHAGSPVEGNRQHKPCTWRIWLHKQACFPKFWAACCFTPSIRGCTMFISYA